MHHRQRIMHDNRSGRDTLSRPARPARPHGFTLIELVIIMAIIGVVTAMALPRYTNMVKRYRLDAAARRLQSDLMMARDSAISASASRAFTLDLTRFRYTVQGVADLRDPGTTYSVALANDPYGCTVKAVGAGAATTWTINFNGHGLPDQGGTFHVFMGDAYRVVTVDAVSGQVTLT